MSTASSCHHYPHNPTAQFGAIAGVVSSSQGAIAKASVTAVSDSGGEYVATTDANGNYLITNVPDGNGTVSVSVLPAGCTVPNPVSYAVAARRYGQHLDHRDVYTGDLAAICRSVSVGQLPTL